MQPDGYLEIEFIDHETLTYYFKDISKHSGSLNKYGIMIWYPDRYVFHPWATIRSYGVTFNSEDYQKYQNGKEENNG